MLPPLFRLASLPTPLLVRGRMTRYDGAITGAPGFSYCRSPKPLIDYFRFNLPIPTLTNLGSLKGKRKTNLLITVVIFRTVRLTMNILAILEIVKTILRLF